MANDIPELEFPSLSEQFKEIADKMLNILKLADVNENVAVSVGSNGSAVIHFANEQVWYIRPANTTEYEFISRKGN